MIDLTNFIPYHYSLGFIKECFSVFGLKGRNIFFEKRSTHPLDRSGGFRLCLFA